MALLLVYTLSFLLYRSIFEYMDTRRMVNAFPSITNIVEYTQYLDKDQYNRIPIQMYPSSSMIVFDTDQGKMIYASDEQIRQNIYYDDLAFINDYSQQSYFNVSKIQDKKGDFYYLVDLEKYDGENEIQLIYEHCILDSKYRILQGDMFPEYDALDQRQLNLMQGFYNKKMNIEKYSFENERGEGRVLVFVSPQMTEDSYNTVILEGQKRQLYVFLLFLMIVIVQLVLFRFMVKRSFLPFQNAIISYREDANTDFDENLIPIELRQTAREFKYTMLSLEQSKQEARETNQEKYAMISGISHDLKTPLTVIRGFSKALLEHRVSKDKEEKYLQTIYDRSIKASDLMDSLFEYVKIEHPSYMPQFEKVDICEYTKQFFASKYQEIIDHGFKLEIDIPDFAYYSLIDKKLFDRVLENIVENSLHHNTEGTTIYVQIIQHGKQNIWIMSDDGVGMDKETSKNIFIPFVTGDASRTQKKGSGLGMAIAHKIVILHHGNIQLHTHVSKAHMVEFKICLPSL